MKILGIDPGPQKSAYVIIQLPEYSIFQRQYMPNREVIDCIRYSPLDLVDVCAIEMVQSFGMAVGREVFETVLWIGRFAEAWDWKQRQRNSSVSAALIYRTDIKMNLCHNTHAKDSNIRQALIDRFGPPGTKKNPGPTYGLSGDIWSAFAVAVTCADFRDITRKETP